MRQFSRALHNVVARLDVVDVRMVLVLALHKLQVIEDEAEVGLAIAMIDHRDIRIIGGDLFEHRLD